VGGAVATVAISMATGPAGVMLVLDVISAVGTTMAAGSDLYIDSFASKFFVESSNCRDATCAKNIVYTHLVKMQNYANQGDLSYAQLEVADTEIARLVELIPEQDDFWVDLINSGAELSVSSAAENANAFDFSRWEPEHWVRALGTALEMVTLVQAAGEMFLRFNPKTAQSLNKAVNAVKTKVSNVIASLSKSDDAADAADAAFRAQLSAKRAALREKLAKRAALRERIASGEIIRGTDGPIVIPKGQMAAGIRKADGTVTITAKSKYKFVNALDNVTQSELGKSLNVGFVGDDMVYHMDGLTKPQLAGMKEILSDHNIPYYEHTTGGILFYEKDIVRFGSDIDPNLSSKVRDMLQFEEQAMAQTDDFAKAATQTSEKTIRMFNNNIYLEDLYRVAANKREKILNIVARDSELTDIALNFETASLERKQRFAQKILNNLEGGNITAEVKISHSAVGEQDKARIIFGLNHKENTSLDGFITTLSHEHNHYINQYKPKTGALADLPEEILDRTITNRELFDEYFPNADYDWYYINSLDEQSSYYIGDHVGQGFKKDLIDLISPRR
ncbi:MAG: hypothetical protein J6K82_01755, partial [Alphaproteobacteria bacterium]|nr:hypothetical protein [Alphaproteobacteria bacterium]